jgi:hypothetical protein
LKVALQNGEIREIKSSTTGKTLYQWEEEVVSKGVEMDHATTIGTGSTGIGSGVFEGLWAALDFSSLQPQGASLTAMGSGLPTFQQPALGFGGISQPQAPFGNQSLPMIGEGSPTGGCMGLISEELPQQLWQKLDEAGRLRWIF